MTSTKRQEANRRNAQKSTGPRTQEGKARSAQNSFKHGLTAKDVVVGNEDPAAFEALRSVWLEKLTPADELEIALIDKAVVAAWRAERCVRAERARVDYKLRHALIDYDVEKAELAETLGRRLLVAPMTRSERTFNAGRTGFRDVADTEPSAIVRRLRSFSQGVDWLKARWDTLMRTMAATKFWLPAEQAEAIRLLGCTADQVLSDATVARIVMSCSMLCDGFDEISDKICQHLSVPFDVEAVEFELRLPWLESLRPETRVDAFKDILTLPWVAMTELEELKESGLDAIEAFDRAEVEARALADMSHESALLLRYEAARDRELHRALNALYKKRKEERDAKAAGETEADTWPPDPAPFVAPKEESRPRNEANAEAIVANPGASPPPSEANAGGSGADSGASSPPSEANGPGIEESAEYRETFETLLAALRGTPDRSSAPPQWGDSKK